MLIDVFLLSVYDSCFSLENKTLFSVKIVLTIMLVPGPIKLCVAEIF